MSNPAFPSQTAPPAADAGAAPSAVRGAPREKWFSLQLIRGLAALLVVAAHAREWNFMEEGKSYHPSSGLVPDLASIAVYVFFCLSGIVIGIAHGHEIGAPAADRKRLFAIFWIKRILRLYPAYFFFSLAAFVLYRLGFSSVDSMVRHIDSWKGAFSAALLMKPNYVALAPAWSLCHEMLFYGIFGLFLLRPVLGWLAVAATVAMMWMNLFGTVLLLGGIFGRVNWFFAIGTLLFLFRRRIPYDFRCTPWFVAASLLVCYWTAATWGENEVFLFFPLVHAPPGFKSMLLASLAIVLLFVPALKSPGGRGNSWFHKAGYWLGGVSYSLYLCHVVVQTVIFHFIGRPDNPWRGILYIAVPIGVAWLSYRFLEQSCIRWAQTLARKVGVRA